MSKPNSISNITDKEGNRYESILKYIKEKFPEVYKEREFLPEAYCENLFNVKLIVLGCDPTAKSAGDYCFEKVFAMGNKDKKFLKEKCGDIFNECFMNKDKFVGYFKATYINIKEVNSKLDLSDIYIQNLCRNYNILETSKLTKVKEEVWIEMCRVWAEKLYNELEEAEIPNHIPVLLTGKDLIKPLLKKGSKYFEFDAKRFYKEKEYIPAKENILERPLIPLFRGLTYELNDHELEKNIKRIKDPDMYNRLSNNIEEYKTRNKEYAAFVNKLINGLNNSTL